MNKQAIYEELLAAAIEWALWVDGSDLSPDEQRLYDAVQAVQELRPAHPAPDAASMEER